MQEPNLAPSYIEKRYVAFVSFAFGLICALLTILLFKLSFTDRVHGWWNLPWLLGVMLFSFSGVSLLKYAWWALTAPVWEYEFDTGYNRRQENLRFAHMMDEYVNPPKSDDFKMGFSDYLSRNKAMAKPNSEEYRKGWQAGKESYERTL